MKFHLSYTITCKVEFVLQVLLEKPFGLGNRSGQARFLDKIPLKLFEFWYSKSHKNMCKHRFDNKKKPSLFFVNSKQFSHFGVLGRERGF